jgi:hypothetical protein
MTTNRAHCYPGVLEVLRHFRLPAEPTALVVRQINRGHQGDIYAVRRDDLQPLWGGYPELLVKMYKATSGDTGAIVHEAFQSMTRINTSLGGRVIAGWSIWCPVPLFQCGSPAALVMTRVPGRPLDSYLRAGSELTPEVVDSITRVIVTCLTTYWADTCQPYGDLNFSNLLCDLPAQALSFVDPGIPEPIYRCDRVAKNWYPASRDLAHLLYHIASSLRPRLGDAGFRRRRRGKGLLEGILGLLLSGINPASRRKDLLDEIDSCARVHLGRIQVSWSPGGMWRRFVRQFASGSIDETLRRLRDAVSGAPGSTDRAGAPEGTALPCSVPRSAPHSAIHRRPSLDDGCHPFPRTPMESRP